MKYKYIAISGKIMESETNESLSNLKNGYDGSVTPLCEIGGKEYWNREATRGFTKGGIAISKKEWIECLCPVLEVIYAYE
jgi:hypothetical protein